MAPRKTQVDGDAKGKGKAVVVPSSRVTRSMDRKTRSGGAGSSSSKLMNFESPEKKKRKTTAKDGGAKKKTKKEEAEAEEEEAEEKEDDVAAEEDDDVAVKDDSDKRKIVIEHCKQCTSFKTRANQVKKGVEEAVPGVIVTLNAVKPRRGCFEIREEGGETFVSLLDMKRPFTSMKELDMEQVIADIVEKIKG